MDLKFFHKGWKKYFLSGILIFSLLCGCSIHSSKNTNADFKKFTFSLFQQELSSNTLNLHYTLRSPENYGIKNTLVTFGEFSTDPVTAMASAENCHTRLKQFPYSSLSKENKRTYDILDAHLRLSKKGADFLLYDEPLGPVTGIQSQLPVLLAEFPFHTKKDIDTYLELLESSSSYFHSLIDLESLKAEKGLFMPEKVLDDVLNQCQSFLSMGEKNYLFSTFEHRIRQLDFLSQEEKNDYIKENHDRITSCLLPSYQFLFDSLSSLRHQCTNFLGVCRFPDGKKYYEFVAERETGSSRSLLELKTMIRKQMAEDAKKIHSLPLSDINSGSFCIGNNQPADFVSDLKTKIKKTFPPCVSVHETIKYVPEEMEPYLSPAFYLIPCIDDISENVIYINRAHTMDELNLYTTLAHEGYPGHLYQTTYFASRNTEPLRSLLYFGGYIEGWATYTEMGSYYLAPISKAHASFSQKSSSFLLGLYASADIGIHYDGWTLKDTISFFEKYGIKDKDTIEEIYTLIVSDPGNYLKYYIGYLEFMDLKKEAVKKEGPNFSQTKFHQKILEIGPAPFSIVKKYVLES